MKKILAFVLAFTMVFCLVAVSASADVSERTIRFSTTSAETTDVVKTMREFAEIVAEKSEGKMTVEVYPASELGDVATSFQNAQLGVLDMCITNAATLSSAGASDFIALSLPYVFKNVSHMCHVIQGEIGEAMLDSAEEAGTGVVGIGFWGEGPRCFFSKEPIRSIEDVKGMKIRCQQLDIDTAMTAALGASPTPIAFAELYSSLQSGVVDGAENPLSGIYSGKYYEICKYVTLDQHTAAPVIAIFSGVIWNTYSDEEKAIIKEAWAEASADNEEIASKNQELYVELLEKEGVEVIELHDMDKWVEAMQPVYDEFGKDVTEIIAAMAAID